MKGTMTENTKTEIKESEIKLEHVDDEETKTEEPEIDDGPDIKPKTKDANPHFEIKQEPLEIDMTLEMKQESNGDVEIKLKSDIKKEASDADIHTHSETDNSQIDSSIPVIQDIHMKSECKNDEVIMIDDDENETESKKDYIKTVNVEKFKRKRKRPAIRKRTKKTKLVEKSIEITSFVSDTGLESVTSPETPADDIEYCLTVTNLPNNWSFMDIKNYIDTECGPVDEIEMLKDDKTGNGAIRLSYQTEQECRVAMVKLKNKEIDGTKLVLEMSAVSLELESPAQMDTSQTESPTTKQWRPDLDIWDIDPEGIYGLRPAFLKSLGITPPLDKWVHVSNFRCDKSELRDVLDMAGTVLMCSVITATPRYANVMYSHPLEAVQAVSMLNAQKFYGQALKVVMDRSPVNTVVLPKGLATIGPGLGAHGKPLRNITKHYQRLLTNKSSSINLLAFEVPDKQNDQSANQNKEEQAFVVKSVDDFNYVIPNSTTNSTATSSTSTTTTVTKSPVNSTPAKPTPESKPDKPPQVVQKPITSTIPVRSPNPRPNFPPQNFLRNNFGPNFGQRPFGPNQGPGWNGQGLMRPGMPGPMGPMGGPMRPMPGPMPGPMPRPLSGSPRPMQRPPGPMSGPMPRPAGPLPRPTGSMPGLMSGPMHRLPGPIQPPAQPGPAGPWGVYPGNEPVQLQLSSLPPSTTFHVLCEKMAQCGQVVSIQLTTPGCAVVTFANRMQADRCFQTYHGMWVEGHTMQVKYT